MSAIWVEITGTQGSAPRDAGTAMKVTADATYGTIGGGALELQAIVEARQLLDQDTERTRTIPLGPGLGQCCGGSVTLRFSRTARPIDPAPQAPEGTHHRLIHPIRLWLWGAGHVGRAVVQASPAQASRITWVDSDAERFPARIPEHVTPIPASDMPLLAARAPQDAHHVIFTYSHEIDLALCAALLRRGAASIGLIGSKTKRARFWRRLRTMGLDPSPITCPIGDPSLGKRPDQIASGVVTSLLAAPQRRQSA